MKCLGCCLVHGVGKGVLFIRTRKNDFQDRAVLLELDVFGHLSISSGEISSFLMMRSVPRTEDTCEGTSCAAMAHLGRPAAGAGVAGTQPARVRLSRVP